MRHIKLFEEYNKGLDAPFVVYIHGLDSDPGIKGDWLKKTFSNVYAPKINYRRKNTKRIFNSLLTILKKRKVGFIIGSSMGGYMAYWLAKKLGVPALLFNPAIASRSLNVDVDKSGSMPVDYDIVLGKNDDTVDPVRTEQWLEENEIDSNYLIHEENIGHRIPFEMYQDYVLMMADKYDYLVSVQEKMSGEVLKPSRKQWVKIDPRKHREFEDEFYELIDIAYRELGGNAKIKEPSDVFADPDATFWRGVDVHGSPDLDLIIWGKDTKYGVKFSGVGHDGERDTKREYLDRKAKDLSKLGYFNEVSGKLAEIMIKKYNVNVVDSEEEVRKLIPKDITWHGKHPEDPDMPGEGWYSRKIGGKPHTKIVIGKPKNL